MKEEFSGSSRVSLPSSQGSDPRSSYIDTPPIFRRWGEVYQGHYWRAHTFDRLAFIYGYPRARAIMGGTDPATQSDISAWNLIGRRDAA